MEAHLTEPAPSAQGRAGASRAPKSASPKRVRLLATLRALAAPRRAVPTLLVAGSLLAAEAVYATCPLAVFIDLGLCVAFWLLAPAAWRFLCTRAQPVVGHLAFVAMCTATVLMLGLAIPALVGAPATYLTEPPALALVVVMYVVGGWGLGRDIELEEGLTAERKRGRQLAHQAEHAQLLALRAQLDPHFLFNTLNAIAEWCQQDPAVAEAATLKLAEVLRSILDGVKTPTWPLHREVRLLRELFELYELRDADRYRLQCEVADVPSQVVPPLILLPAFENAITHGPSAGHAGSVKVLRPPR